MYRPLRPLPRKLLPPLPLHLPQEDDLSALLRQGEQHFSVLDSLGEFPVETNSVVCFSCSSSTQDLLGPYNFHSRQILTTCPCGTRKESSVCSDVMAKASASAAAAAAALEEAFPSSPDITPQEQQVSSSSSDGAEDGAIAAAATSTSSEAPPVTILKPTLRFAGPERRGKQWKF